VTVVDTSVWVDYFRGNLTPEIVRLQELSSIERLGTGDLIIVEVLQGIADDNEFELVKKRLTSLEIVNLGGLQVSIEAAENYRQLRSLGITVRKTIDTIIATYCILHGHDLLYSDRDFDPFVKYRKLRSAMRGI
jgi:predicted nucleic acid-binding protein